MVRLEHSTNNMMEEFKEISLQVNDFLISTRTELTETKQQLQKDQSNSSRAMTEQFDDLSRKIKSEFETLKRGLGENKRHIEDEKQIAAEFIGPSSYAFNAQWIRDTSPSVGDTLIFTRVPLNKNSAYSNSTGEYTVPVDGTYMFTTTLCTYSNDWVKINILADETVMHMFFPASLPKYTYICTSTSTIGQLQRGMKVKIIVQDKHTGSQVFYQYENDRMCTFSGFLIK